MTTEKRVADIRERVRCAALRVGRKPEEILLVAASKMQDAAAVRQAFAAGVTVFGENRVQEMLDKDAQDAYAGAQLHFIGHLQRNKVRSVVGRVSLIQSVHSEDLLREIERHAAQRDMVQDVLLEVNIGQESSKQGLPAGQVLSAAELASTLPHLCVRGLMAIPPVGCAQQTRKYFMSMRQLYLDTRARIHHNNRMDVLSMGMSDDFELAIEEGTTMIRVGTALFGARTKTTELV